jgi:hypothetical protein
MGGIIQVDSVLNNNTSNLITQTNSTTITIGSTGQTISLASGASSSGFGLTWNPTVQTTNFTASVGVGYMVNTTTAAITATLPAAPSIGDQIQFVDFNETAATNNITLNPNGLKIDGVTSNTNIVNGGEGVTIMYSGTTRGWIPVSAANEGTQALASLYSLDFLVIAGGGGGGASGFGDNYALGGGGAGGYRTSTQTIRSGTIITVTVGDGGGVQTNGSNSSISGTGLTTITSAGGGAGAYKSGNPQSGYSGTNGGSGGGGGMSDTPLINPSNGGSGNTPSTSPSQGNNGGTGTTASATGAGGGGGAGATGSNGSSSTGGNGGAGTASSITGSSVTRGGGGGGGAGYSSTAGTGGTGGTGGGGNGSGTGNGTSGTANTGGGGGGGRGSYTSGSGGKGVVIISLATIHYSGTSSGSPTVTTSGSNTILQFNGSGTYTV